MRCMKKIDEAFNEDDHPRGQPDNDGQFVASGTGSKTKTKRKTKRKTSKPKQSDSAFSWRDISKPLSTKQKFNYRSRSHDIKVYRSRGKNYPQTINISKATNPEYVRAFTGFWNTDPSIKAMIKHIDYLGLEYQNNPKRGGVWYGDDKKVIIYDYPYQSLGHFKSTTVHEIVGHTFWDLAREYFRNDLIEFNELANKMPPVNQYCKDNEEKWKSWNDEKRSQISALDKKYGVTKDEYGYTDASTQLWGEDADKYQEAINKINDGKFIGNPSNEFMNRDSSSMTRYANEQHSAITEIMYGTLKDSSDEGAKEVLIGKEDLDRMKVLWLKLHPKFPQKVGESWNPFNEELTMRCMKKVGGNEAETLSVIRLVSSEAFQEQEHPRDGDGKFSTKGGGGSPKSDILKKYLKKIPLSIPDKHNNKSIPLIKETDYLVDNKPSFITSDGIYLSNDIMRGWEYPESHADILGHITGLNLKDIDTDKTAKVAGELNLVRVLIDTELTIHVTSKLSMSQLSQINKLVKEWTGEVDIEYDIGTDGGLDRFGTDDRKEFQNKLREKGWMAEAFVEQEHPRDGGGKFAKKGSIKSDKETVDKVIDKIKNTWDDVSPTVHGSHFLTPNGEIIGNYNHNTMVTDLAPMIDGFELTGKIIHGGGKLKNMETGEWYDEEKTIESYAGWKDITKFLGKTGFVRATNEGKSESGYGHTINLTVNGTLTSSQIRAIQRMEQTSAGGTTLNFDIMGDETQSGHGTFRDFMKAYRKNYGAEAFVEDEHPRDNDGKFSDKGSNSIVDTTVEDGKAISKRLKKNSSYGFSGEASFYEEAGIEVDRENYKWLGHPIKNKNEYDGWKQNIEYFEQQLKESPKLANIYDSFKKQVKEYNVKLEKKYNKAETFKRGTSIEELESYIEDDCISCDYRDIYNYDLKRDYEFLSLSMNEQEIKDTYNFGVVIDFNAESVRNIGERVEYTAKPTAYPAMGKVAKSVKKLEGIGKKYSALMSDEQEVRIPRDTKLSDVKIDKITINLYNKFGIALQMANPDLFDEYRKPDANGDYISQKELWNKNKEEIIKSIKNKYSKLTDNIEVYWK